MRPTDRQDGSDIVALQPGSEKPDIGAPDDYAADHPAEHPSDWGWHGEWGRWARISGWFVVFLLVLSTTATHYNGAGALALIATAVGLAIVLVWDINRRRTSWRQ
jgi:hypothetical protein